MQHAIEVLKQRLETAEHNGKIRRESGDTEQADLDDTVAYDCRVAISILTASESGDREEAAILKTLRDSIVTNGGEHVEDYAKFLSAVDLRDRLKKRGLNI